MSAHFKDGFTIIETMLVLAVTGVLVSTLLFGIGSSIAVQRYGDSVTSFRSLLQDQYARVSSVSNGRGAGWSCNASATPVQGGNTAPGQTDCVLLGRYISVVDGAISMATVVGYQTSSSAAANDMQSVKDNYALGLSDSSVETKTLEWGARIAWPKTGTGASNPTTPRSIAFFILRSPESGTTYTFTSNDVTPISAVSSLTLKNMLVQTTASFPGQGSRTICIEPDAPVPEKFGVYVAPVASGANSIETRSFEITTAEGGDTKC